MKILRNISRQHRLNKILKTIMGELQATIEFSVELYKFYNVDLFQRGFYQVRTYLRLSPRLTAKIEISLPSNSGDKALQQCSSQLVFPACIVNGTAVSKTFQILYRNEEVALDDVILFKTHLIVDSKKIEESLQKADFQLVVELWFTEQTFGPDQYNSIQCVSSRVLKFHLCPLKGLHHHLPVLFDYFHLSAVSVTVHGCLLAIHQPYVNISRAGKHTWLNNSPKVSNRFQNSASLESVLFGNMALKPSPSFTRLSQAHSVHQNICTLLLSSYESLQSKLLEYMNLLPPWQQLQIEVTDCYSKLKRLREVARGLEAEDEILAVVNSDIAQLCAENIILWQQFLEVFTLKDRIQQHLAREHHMQRVKRFAEGFFVVENTRQSIFHCAEQSYQTYLTISDSIRKTKYFSTLPSLGVECVDMDGSFETLPVIFEDHYQDLAKHRNSHGHISSKTKIGTASVNEINLTLANEEIANLHPKKASSGSDKEAWKCSNSKSDRRKRNGAKKEKPVGCFTGIAPKSSVSSEELCYSSSKRAMKGSVSIDKSIGTTRTASSNLDSYRVPPKNSISVEELARIKEDYKMRVLESKLYRVVPDMPPPSNQKTAQMTKQEMFRARNSKSLSAVEEFRGHFMFQAPHPGGIPRLETVPILTTPLRHSTEPRRAPRLEELRLQKAKLDFLSLRLDLQGPKITLEGSAITAGKNVAAVISPTAGSVTTASVPSNSTKPSDIRPNSKEVDTSTSSSSAKTSCGNESGKAVKAVSTSSTNCSNGEGCSLSMLPEGKPCCAATVGNGFDGMLSSKTNRAPSILPENGKAEKQKAAVLAPPKPKSDCAKPESDKEESPPPEQPQDPFRNKLKGLKLDLMSVNEVCRRACQTQQKVDAQTCKKLNGLQLVHTSLKAQSPTGSTSSDSVVLMGYKKLEQSESLPVGLSWIGRRAKSAIKHAKVSKGFKKMEDYSMETKASLHRTRNSLSMPNVNVLGESDADRSLIGSESMPDLGGDSATTRDDVSVASEQTGKENPNCQWSSCDSFVMLAPHAMAEESENEGRESSSEEFHATVKSEEVAPPAVTPSSAGITSSALLELKKRLSSSPASRSTLGSMRKHRRRSGSSSSTTTSERSGWVSSQRSSSDSSSSEESPGSPPSSTRRKHSTSDVGSFVTKSSQVDDEDVALLSSNEEERHIYEEIHLPPEEFRDPPTGSSATKPSVVPLPFKKSTLEPPKHKQPQQRRNGGASSRRQSRQSGVATHPRLTSSSSRETGYSSDRQNSKEEIGDSGTAMAHRSRPRNAHSVRSRHERDTAMHKTKAKVKRREHETTAYLETKCTILEMFADTTFQGYARNNGHHWSSGAHEGDDDEDDVANVPAPPPPASRVPPSVKENGRMADDEAQTPSTATEGEMEHEGKTNGTMLVSLVGYNTVNFVKAKEDFKRQLNLQAFLYSDCPMLASTIPYFHVSEDFRLASTEGLHLVICVHGLDGNSADLRLVKTYLELGLPCSNLEFLMSERNQGDTFSDFDKMTDKLVAEILYHIEVYRIAPAKISFIGHSLGNIIIRSALVRPQMKPLLNKLHTFLSLSGPHLGTLYNSSGLVNMGLWFMQKWKKSGSLLQLSMKDAADIRRTFMYKLSQKPGLEYFNNILLFGSSQDRYVPIHSARIELCKAAIKDSSVQGSAYRDMVHGLLQPVARNPNITFVRYDVHHALPNTANSLIGRAAHIAVLDSELFIEKFLTVCGLKYFK